MKTAGAFEKWWEANKRYMAYSGNPTMERANARDAWNAAMRHAAEICLKIGAANVRDAYTNNGTQCAKAIEKEIAPMTASRAAPE